MAAGGEKQQNIDRQCALGAGRRSIRDLTIYFVNVDGQRRYHRGEFGDGDFLLCPFTLKR